MGKPYLVTGNKTSGYAVLTPDGAVKYDLLDTRSKASDIAAVLNDGIGPEWDAVERELDRRANAKASRKRKGGREQNPKSTSGRSITMTDPRELSAEEIKRLQVLAEFMKGLKPLRLSYISVADPGKHITDLIDENAALRENVQHLLANFERLGQEHSEDKLRWDGARQQAVHETWAAAAKLAEVRDSGDTAAKGQWDELYSQGFNDACRDIAAELRLLAEKKE